MNKNFCGIFASVILAIFASGCWTLHQTDYPSVSINPAAANRENRVVLSGFESTLTSYTPIYTHETVWRPHYAHHHGRMHHHGLHSETYTSTTFIEQTNPTTAFVERAREKLEDAGYIVSTSNAQFRVDVKFTGPTITRGDNLAATLWTLCSLLSADYSAQTWHANLRIYDVASGKLLFHSTYEQKYRAAVWGLVPLLSPAAASETDANYCQTWCLSALTDRAIAEASTFLAANMK